MGLTKCWGLLWLIYSGKLSGLQIVIWIIHRAMLLEVMRMDGITEKIPLQSVDNILGIATFNWWEEAEVLRYGLRWYKKASTVPDQWRERTRDHSSYVCSCMEEQGTQSRDLLEIQILRLCKSWPIRCGRRKEASRSISCPSSSSRTVSRNGSYIGFVETTGAIEQPAVFVLRLWPAQ